MKYENNEKNNYIKKILHNVGERYGMVFRFNFTLTLFSSVSMTTLTTPPRFVKGHKRHSSTDMTPSRGKTSYKQCSQDDSCVTRLSGMYEREKQKKIVRE